MPDSAHLHPVPAHLTGGIPLQSSMNDCLASLIRFVHWAHLIVEDLLGRIVRQISVLFLALAILVPVTTDGQASTVLVVTGSSMPEPLYLLWNEEFHKQQPGVQVRYLPEGSGVGATRVLTGTGDFGGGDAPIPEKELKGSATKIIELPTVLIGIVVVYNLPSVSGDLELSGASPGKHILRKNHPLERSDAGEAESGHKTSGAAYPSAAPLGWKRLELYFFGFLVENEPGISNTRRA